MPNYRYHTPDYMRRNSYSRQTAPVSPSCQSDSHSSASCPSASYPSVSCPSESRSSDSKKTCCDNRSEYDALKGMPIAMAYVPWQKWCSLYEAEKGFQRGTIFEELDKPFKGIGGCCR